MKKRSLLAGATLLLAATSVLAGCGGNSEPSGGGSDGPFRIVVSGGITSAIADNAKTSVLGAKAAVAKVNADGGIGGRKVELTVIDDKLDPQAAITELRNYISKNGAPDVYLNSGPSTIAAATLPILNSNKILSFNIGPNEDSFNPDKYPLNFDLSPSGPDYAKAFVPYVKEKGYTAVGIIHSNTPSGQAIANGTEDALKAAGINVVANEEYDAAALDMTPQLQRIQAAKADALIFDGYGAPVGYTLKSLSKLGWDVPLIGDISVASTGLVSTDPPSGVLGTSEVKNLVVQVFKSVVRDPADTVVNDAITAMTAIDPITSTVNLAYNYDAVVSVAAAAKESGKTDAESLAKALETPSVQEAAPVAILKRYNWTADSHSPNASEDTFTYVAPSKLVNGQFQP